MKELWTIEETATELRVPEASVLAMINDGRLRSSTKGGVPFVLAADLVGPAASHLDGAPIVLIVSSDPELQCLTIDFLYQSGVGRLSVDEWEAGFAYLLQNRFDTIVLDAGTRANAEQALLNLVEFAKCEMIATEVIANILVVLSETESTDLTIPSVLRAKAVHKPYFKSREGLEELLSLCRHSSGHRNS